MHGKRFEFAMIFNEDLLIRVCARRHGAVSLCTFNTEIEGNCDSCKNKSSFKLISAHKIFRMKVPEKALENGLLGLSK